MYRPEREWEKFGKTEPYYGVMTEDKFKTNKLTEAAKDEFFQTGQRHIEQVMYEIRHYLFADFNPLEVLDFGCGVGRLVVPLARQCESVVGVDFSISMLKEAEKNCQKFRVRNVRFVNDIFALKNSAAKFDLVHSYIVFQHIPVRNGLLLLQVLADLIAPAGIGVIHFPFRCTSFAHALFSYVMKKVPLAYNVWNIFKKRPWSYPYMQMNIYNLNSIFAILKAGGCKFCHCQFMQRDYYEGAVLFFQKEICCKDILTNSR